MNTHEDLDKKPVAGAGLMESVPVIDIGPLFQGDDQEVIDEIASAASTWGFFQITNHGIDPGLIESVLQETRAFFELPADARNIVRRSRENPWGYNDSELTKNQRDKKAIFDFTAEGRDAIYGACNQWPESPAGFRPVMMAYLRVCTSVSLRLVDAFSVGAGLPVKALRALFEPQHTGFIRLNYYPTKDPQDTANRGAITPADLGIHHHTDAGAVTLLLQDQVAGLQVLKDDFWHDVVPADGALVVNTGDMMQVLSNDFYQAPVHRVRAMTEKDRYSVPFFLNMAAHATVQPVETMVTDQRPARYRPIPWSEFRSRRSDGDYADYGSEVQISDYALG